LFLIAAITMPAATIGCAAHVRVYDSGFRDYHSWDDHEDRAYRRYLNERHEEYREFNKRNAKEQEDYWKWRHSHQLQLARVRRKSSSVAVPNVRL
jgi:hypothetical protein